MLGSALTIAATGLPPIGSVTSRLPFEQVAKMTTLVEPARPQHLAGEAAQWKRDQIVPQVAVDAEVPRGLALVAGQLVVETGSRTRPRRGRDRPEE